MNKSFIPLVLAGLGFLVSTNALAKDVYVYAPSGAKVGEVAQVKRLEFNNDKIVLVPEKGESVSVPIANFGFLSFTPQTTGGINSVKNVSAKLRLEGELLMVESDQIITGITIYNLSGVQECKLAPNSNSASVVVSEPGIHIVVVESEGAKSSYKIVR